NGPLDTNAALYADEGFLYWFTRGAPWEDQGPYSGIRTLISARLPWPASRMESTRAFFSGLTTPLNDATGDLVRLADQMESVQADLDRAIEAESFDIFYLPGALFH